MSSLIASPHRQGLVGEPLVVLGAVAVLGSLAPRAALPCLALALIWVACSRPTLRFALLCVCAFVIFGVQAEGARARYRRSWTNHAERFAGVHRCTLSGWVSSRPTAQRSLTSPPALDESFLVSVREGACGERPIGGGTVVRLTKGGTEGLARGDELDVIADLGPTRLFRNAALADPFDGAARHGAVLAGRILSHDVLTAREGFGALVDRARAHVRRRILATYAPGAVALGRALVLGESDLDQAEGDAFRRSGLMHLLAVSGTHLVIAVLGLVEALRTVLVRVGPLSRRFDVARLSAFLGALSSVLYADFAGGSGSAWRAAYMLGLVLGARTVGLRLGGSAALGGSLLVGLAIDPLVGSDISFLLSALATAGLIGIGQPLSASLKWGPFGRFPLEPLVTSLVATVSATITCAPVLALMDGRMTLSALLANVVAGPLGEVLALPACLLHTLMAAVPVLETGLALVGSGALLAVRAVALWSSAQEALAFVLGMPDPWQCVAICAAFVGYRGFIDALRACSGVGRPRLLAMLTVLVIVGVWCAGRLVRRGLEPSGRRLVVTTLDIDQGDALVIDFPDGRLGLVDGGGFATGVPDTGQRVILPYLRARGREHVDLMVLSHVHPDHLLGLISVAEALPVRELWLLDPLHAGGPGFQRLQSAVRAAGGLVRGASDLCPEHASEEVRTFGGAHVTVLAPCDAQVAWSQLGENDRSLVLHVRHGSRSVLLTGDIEGEGERRLVAAYQSQLRADLLKVPHHGSDTSSGSDLLAAVGPQLALISCGVRNRFDHPRASVIARLDAAEVRVLRTDRHGSISWFTDGKRTWLRGFPGEPPERRPGKIPGKSLLVPPNGASPPLGRGHQLTARTTVRSMVPFGSLPSP